MVLHSVIIILMKNLVSVATLTMVNLSTDQFSCSAVMFA